MATLATGKSALAQVDRSRQLATALQQMAVNFEPIQHPYQGLAKLAQAWVASRMMKNADKREKEIANEQRQMLIDALSPVEYEIPTREYDTPVIGEVAYEPDMISGVDVTNFGPLGSGEPIRDTRQKTPQEMIAALDPTIGQEVLGKILVSNMTQKPTDLQQKLALIQQLDPDDSLGLLSSFALEGGLNMGKTNFLKHGSEKPITAVVINGRLFENDPKAKHGIGQPIDMNSGQIIGTTVQVSSLADLKGLKIPQSMVQGVVTLDQFNQLEQLVRSGGVDNMETFAGWVRSAGINTVASARQLAQSLGISFDYLDNPTIRIGGRTVIDRGQLVRLDSRGNPTNWEDEQAISSFNEWRRLGNIDAATTQLGITIAYTLARIADPGGRLSEMDVMNQMRGLQLTSSDEQVRLVALERAKRTFAMTMKEQIDFAERMGQQVNVKPGFMEELDQIIRETDLTVGAGYDFSARDVTELRDALLRQPPPVRDAAIRRIAQERNWTTEQEAAFRKSIGL
jgi:hypothetical protein